jgi:hypothetical protein
MSKGQEILNMVFIAHNKTPEIMHPGKQTFNMPPSAVTSQDASILGGWFPSVMSMRGNKFNALGSKYLIQGITVVGPVSDQSLRLICNEAFFESIPDKGDFMRRSRRSVQGDRKTRAICHCHELRTLAPLGLSDTEAPFFATTKVASIKHSLRSNLPRSRRSVASASKILRNTPERTHSWNLRWQV